MKYRHAFHGTFFISTETQQSGPGRVAQSVMCLTADPGVGSWIQGLRGYHTFAEIEHEIISMAILLLSADSRRAVVSYKRKYVHKVLVNCLDKLAYIWKSVVRCTDHPDMTIAVNWDV